MMLARKAGVWRPPVFVMGTTADWCTAPCSAAWNKIRGVVVLGWWHLPWILFLPWVNKWDFSPGFVAFWCVWRGQWKLRLLLNVDSLIVLGPVSGSFSWQSQMVLPNYRANAPSNTCCCLPPCHYCRQRNNITLSHERKNWQKRGLTHYPPSLRCTPTRVSGALFGGLGQFVIYFYAGVMSIVSTENV